jgi:hypothetical protein
MKKTVFLLALILPVCTVIAQLPEPAIPVPGNVSLVNQDGMLNHVTVTQDGAYNLSTVNTLGIFNRESSVDQDGGMNNSTAFQLGIGNKVDVTQVNADLEDDVDNLNFSWITQLGMGNEVEVIQNHQAYEPKPNAKGTLDAFVLQTGSGNRAKQYQTGMRDLAIVYQDGRNGVAVQKQGNSQFMEGNSYSALAVIVQESSSKGSEAYQHQVGTWNAAGILQGADDGIAKQEQLSDKTTNPSHIPLDLPNVAGIVQEELGFFKKDNEAYQVQFYDGVSTYGNWAGALQLGGGNVSTQIHHGGNNLSGVLQIGAGNEAYVKQSNGTPPAEGRMTMAVPFH